MQGLILALDGDKEEEEEEKIFKGHSKSWESERFTTRLIPSKQ